MKQKQQVFIHHWKCIRGHGRRFWIFSPIYVFSWFEYCTKFPFYDILQASTAVIIIETPSPDVSPTAIFWVRVVQIALSIWLKDSGSSMAAVLVFPSVFLWMHWMGFSHLSQERSMAGRIGGCGSFCRLFCLLPLGRSIQLISLSLSPSSIVINNSHGVSQSCCNESFRRANDIFKCMHLMINAQAWWTAANIFFPSFHPPDRTFHNFRASRSGDQRFFITWNSPLSWYRGPEFVNCPVGLQYPTEHFTH